MNRPLLVAYVGCAIVGAAVAFAFFSPDSHLAAPVGALGALLEIACLVWLLRKETSR